MSKNPNDISLTNEPILSNTRLNPEVTPVDLDKSTPEIISVLSELKESGFTLPSSLNAYAATLPGAPRTTKLDALLKSGTLSFPSIATRFAIASFKAGLRVIPVET